MVAESEREALEALAQVRVDYEPLPAVFDVEEALKPGAPVVNETYPKNTFEYHGRYDHQKLRFGDVERGFAAADHVLEDALPDVADRARADRDQRLRSPRPRPTTATSVYTSTQALFFSLDTAAKILNVPSNRLHFIGGTVGGGFGGKVDTLTEPLAHPRRHADRAARSATCSTARRRCSSARRAAPSACIVKDGVMQRRPDRRAQGHAATSTAAPIPGSRATR